MKYNKQISFGYDRNGKRIRKWFHADTKADLNFQIEAYKDELKKVSNPSDITFQAYSEQWLNTYKLNRSKQTVDMYKNALRKCTELDPYRIKRITQSMCQAVINESWNHPSAAKTLALTLKQIFKSAIADGIIATNPASILTLPKKPQSHFYLLTKEDLDKIRNAELNDSDRLLVTILQVFGLRPAEALALQKTDFDFDEGFLHISKALELSNDNRSQIKSTKTGVSRDIPIPDELIPSLKAQIRPIKGFLLFTKQDGQPYTKSAYRRMSERIHKAINEVVIKEKLEELKEEDKAKEKKIKSTDFFPYFTLYCFRHRRATDFYYLTQQAGSHVTAKYAAKILGHSEMVFLSTYSHIDMDMESKNIYKNFDLASVTNL